MATKNQNSDQESHRLGHQSGRTSGQEEETSGSEREEIPLETSNRRIYYVGLMLLVVIILATGSLLYLKIKMPVDTEEKATVIESSKETATEVTISGAVSDQLGRDEINLEVLNGSGRPGVAGKVADELKELGYVINLVGNTKSSATNYVMVNSKYKDSIDVLLTDIKDKYGIASVAGELENSTASARVVIGK